MENPRTTSARDHDDSALTEEPTAASHAGRSGGNLATDVATQDEIDAVDDPEGRTRVSKGADIEHAQEQRPDRPRAAR